MERAYRQGYVLGASGGAVIMWLLFSALFLGWSRRSRPFIPLLAVVFAFFSTLFAVVKSGVRQVEVREQRTLLGDYAAAVADSAAPAAFGPEAIPASAEARKVWVHRRLLFDLLQSKNEVAARHGVTLGEPPAPWMTPAYMANASAHPQVERYWKGVAAFTAEWKAMHVDWYIGRTRAVGREAGLSGPEIEAMVADVRRASSQTQEELANQEALASAALDLHRYLVSVDRRVEYDVRRDMALFNRDAELGHARRLRRHVDAAAMRMEENYLDAEQRTRAWAASLRAEL
jgi:hypothetical protein